MDKNMMAMCGTYCGECEWREKTNCKGCKASQSNMFWGSCQVAKCCIEKGYEHCGFCAELPCDKLQQAFDDPEHGDNGERLINLRNWANGKQEYLKTGDLKKE